MRRARVGLFSQKVGYFAGVCHGIRAFSIHEQPLWIRHGPPVPDAILGLRDWQPDGIIIAASTPALLDAVRDLAVPVVNISGDWETPPLPAVLPDEFAAGRLAAEHLVARHLPHFAMIGLANKVYVRERREGFAAGLAGRPFQFMEHSLLERTGDHWWHWVPRYMQWIDTLPKPIGIFSWNDLDGSYTIDACHALGVRVPEQVAVVSVENDPLVCELCTPPMSSVDVNTMQIGIEAARLLVRLMEGRTPASPILRVPPRSVVPRLSSDVAAIDDPVLVDAIRIMREHVSQPLTIAALVAMLPVSRRDLENRFNARLSCSPLHYMHSLRIERAKRLLVGTDQSVPEVAASAGFGTVRQFATVFKRTTGHTPTDWRRTRETAAPEWDAASPASLVQ